MALWTLIVYAVIGLLLGPLLSSLLATAVFRTDRPIVGNEELLRWILDPVGAAYLLTAASIGIMGAVVRYAGLYHIITSDEDGESVSVLRTVLELFPDLPALFRLCLSAIALAAIGTVPLVLGIAGTYAIWLGDYDVNYYLAEQPPEWRTALAVAGVWSVSWAVAALYLALRILPALPAYLDGYRPVRRAIAEAWVRTRGDAITSLRIFAFCLVVWIIVRAAAHGSFQLLAGAVITGISAAASGVGPILLSVTASAGLAILLDAIISFVGFCFTGTVLTKFYLDETDLHRLAPPNRIRLRSLPRDIVRFLIRWLNPKRSLPILGAITLLSVLLSGLILGENPGDVDFSISGHRSGALMAPENTLLALDRSIESGANYVEIDVQLTRDSVVVVVHDADLMRVAGDGAIVRSTDYADLRDIVQGNDGSSADLRRIATLGEFLDRARGRIGLMIELKYYGPQPQLVYEVVNVIRTHRMQDDVVIVSLELDPLRDVRRIAPEIRTGYVASVAVGDLSRLQVDMLLVTRRMATNRLVRSARREEMEVHVWTLNAASDMLEAVQRGVDGIITDDPRLASRLREELSRLSTAEVLLLRVFDLIPDLTVDGDRSTD